MAVEGTHAGEFIVSEANNYRSRETVVIDTNQTLVAGQVLGVVTASGEYAAFDQDAATGVETAAGIIIEAITTAGTPMEAAIIARDAEVNQSELVWPGDITGPEQTAGEADLLSLGIVVRAAV